MWRNRDGTSWWSPKMRSWAELEEQAVLSCILSHFAVQFEWSERVFCLHDVIKVCSEVALIDSGGKRPFATARKTHNEPNLGAHLPPKITQKGPEGGKKWWKSCPPAQEILQRRKKRWLRRKVDFRGRKSLFSLHFQHLHIALWMIYVVYHRMHWYFTTQSLFEDCHPWILVKIIEKNVGRGVSQPSSLSNHFKDWQQKCLLQFKLTGLL